MNKNLLFLIFGICTVILSIIIISVGPITNKIIGDTWGYLNCELISDQIKLLNGEVTKLNRMKNLCYRQKAFHDMEYTSFIINIILGFVCADLALIHHLGFGKDFEVKTGIIGIISGLVGFVLTLVYICFSGYIFTNDVAYMELTIGSGNDFNAGSAIPKLYENGEFYKWEVHEDDTSTYPDGGIYVTEYENERDDFSNFIRYKDLGKKQYNYDSDYYKAYNNYNDDNGEKAICHHSTYHSSIESNKKAKITNCDNIYYLENDIINNKNKSLYDRWLTALIIGCFVLLCDLGLAFFGFMKCSNFGSTPKS